MLDSLKKALTERALNVGMDHHLAADESGGNTRNGYGRKTVMTETGQLAIEVPRDRQASFDPQVISKYQRRFPGFDEKIVSMYARGMSTREIAGHLHELYGIDVSPDLSIDTTTTRRRLLAATPAFALYQSAMISTRAPNGAIRST